MCSQLTAAIARVETDAAADRRRTGRRVLGRKAILAQSPTARPRSHEPRRKLDPRLAAKDKWPRIEAIQSLKRFRRAYANEWTGWRAGLPATFPFGTYWLKRYVDVDCHPPPPTPSPFDRLPPSESCPQA